MHMKKGILFTLLFIGILKFSFSQSDIVITEIMYNNPGTDSLEFIELHNNGTSTIDLSGFTFTAGIVHTFPASTTLNAGAYLILASDAGAVEGFLGVSSAMEWTSGSLSNGGEKIQLEDGGGMVIDSFTYDDVFPWPDEADGLGSSLVLCNFNNDNGNADNWWPAFTDTGKELSGSKILANPGDDSNCPAGPYARFLQSEVTVDEDAGMVAVDVVLKRGTAPVTITIQENAATTTATAGSDFDIAVSSVAFGASSTLDTMQFSVSITDDSDEELIEVAGIELFQASSSINTVFYPNANTFNINIVDNDRPLSRNMIISGAFDTQPAGAGAKGVELHVLADIPDLSLYGIGSANNGGGSDGVEFTFPAVSATAGQCIFLTDDSTAFSTFFGITADYETTAMSINGDDAIELFESNQVIDVFGDINVDGNGEPWEYLDGWAYRRSGTGPDGETFVVSNWSYSGVDALQDIATNSAAANPFPSCQYSTVAPTDIEANDDMATTMQDEAITIDVLSNDVLPGGFTTLMLLTPPRGSASVQGNSVSFTPEAGFCGGTDNFDYEVCDANSCDTATVTVTVTCPPTFPSYDIGLVTTDNDGNGLPDSLGRTCTLRGIVHGFDLRGGDGVQFTIIDNTGGIAVFDFNINYYNVQEGDDITTIGIIGEFGGLAQMNPDTIIFNSAGNPLEIPTVVTALDESTESELVRLEAVDIIDAAEWTNAGSGFNVRVTNNIDTFVMRIDNDVDIFGTNPPSPSFSLRVTGIGGQFDLNAPITDDYQISPRYMQDIELISTVIDPTLAEDIRYYPNPVKEMIWVESEVPLDQITIRNLLGQSIISIAEPDEDERINLGQLSSGTYWMTFFSEGRSWTVPVVKQ